MTYAIIYYNHKNIGDEGSIGNKSRYKNKLLCANKKA